MSTEPDHVAKILDQWRRERPELDVSPLGVIGRLHRLAETLNVELRALFADQANWRELPSFGIGQSQGLSSDVAAARLPAAAVA